MTYRRVTVIIATMTSQVLKKPARIFYALIFLPVVGVLAFALLKPIQVLPRITLSPGFSLIDQNNSRLTNEDLRGRIVLYNFTYSNCTTPCPQTSQVMRVVQDQLGQIDTGEIPVSLVTISFDPDRDTPERLRVYANQVGADSTKWRIATGDATRLKYALGGGFNLYYAPNGDGTFVFDSLFVLVDGWGIIRAFYKTANPSPDRIVRDINLVVQEARNSTGAAKYAYEAAHLFLCYPP